MKKYLFILALLFISANSYSGQWESANTGVLFNSKQEGCNSLWPSFFLIDNENADAYQNVRLDYLTHSTPTTVKCYGIGEAVSDGESATLGNYKLYYRNIECPVGTVENAVTQSCDPASKDCFNSYNDLDPLLPGIQCSLPKVSGCHSINLSAGNPCDASTGNKFQTETDYNSNTLNFIRYYNSLFENQSVLGKQWTHNLLSFLTINNTIEAHRSNGKVLEFNNETGSWVSDADITDTLTPVGSHWEYKTNNDSIETYNENGQLLTEKTRDGKITTYTYYTNGLLEQVTDPYGRTLDFVYDASSRLVTLTTPENTQIHYAYDEVTNNLISVTYPDNTPGDLTDNPQKIYHYEDANFSNHLTGITDENGHRYATWAYNTSGLATLSEHASSTEKVELAYNTDETTTVTDALGRIKKYTFETHYGLRKPKTIEYTFNDGHQVVTKQKTYTYYPDNGRVKEVTDYNGHITYYEYNDRGLVILETQGKGTSEEYTISTTWHPTYRLPAIRTYPDRTETYSYNSIGQLIHTNITTIQL
ncbi:MAG: DUF6531 domain-containing protein [Gammaproteobacteria bacterium]|nr:DUF6531 domain-containing protein [Gammaproteobacteria bacterium]